MAAETHSEPVTPSNDFEGLGNEDNVDSAKAASDMGFLKAKAHLQDIVFDRVGSDRLEGCSHWPKADVGAGCIRSQVVVL